MTREIKGNKLREIKIVYFPSVAKDRKIANYLVREIKDLGK